MTCIIENCNKKIKYKELCAGHIMRLRRYGSPTGKPIPKIKEKRFCKIDNCNNTHWAKNYCKKHYQTDYHKLDLMELKTNDRLCGKESCGRKHFAYNLCRRHYLSDWNLKAENRYKFLLRTSKDRKIEVTLTFEEFLEFEDKKCFYCETDFKNKGAALDRIDNDKGYSKDNVVKCCAPCNRVRGLYLTMEEMKDLVILLRTKRNIFDIWKNQIK